MKQLTYKIIYNPTINFLLRNLNKSITKFLPDSIKIPPSGIIKLKSPAGDRIKIKTNQTNYLTFLIFWNGYENFEYTDIFVKLIEKVNSFYDIGANIGYYSLLAAMLNKKIEIVAFEPAKGPLYYLKENVTLNNFQNIKIEALALSHKQGEIEFHERFSSKYKYLDYNLSGIGNARLDYLAEHFYSNKVKTTTFNNYIKDHKITSIDLIKMDTEGTENLILENADTILLKMKPIIICETLYNTIEPELDKIMRSYGYEFYNHVEAGLQKVETIIRKEKNGVENCFFVHPEKYHLIEEFVVTTK